MWDVNFTGGTVGRIFDKVFMVDLLVYGMPVCWYAGIEDYCLNSWMWDTGKFSALWPGHRWG